MSIEKFVFKFTDHENTKNTMVKVMVHVEERPKDWIYKKGDEGKEQMLNWFNRYYNWLWELKKEVKKKVADTYFGGDENFGGQILYKKMCFDKTFKVNMNNFEDPDPDNANKDPKMRCKWAMHKYVMKYKKGMHPKPWTSKYDYKTEKYYHNFKLVSKYLDENIAFSPLIERFSINIINENKNNMTPMNQDGENNVNNENNVNDANSTTMDQAGGNINDINYIKYIEYKKKYNQLKNSYFN